MGYSGAYSGFGGSGGDIPPADSIQIDVTSIIGGTPGYVLVVNPDGTLGQVSSSSIGGITIDSTVVNSGTPGSILFNNLAPDPNPTIGDSPGFVFVESLNILAQTVYNASVEGAFHTFVHGRGTAGSPSSTIAGDILGNIAFNGYSSNNTLSGTAAIQSKMTTDTPANASVIPVGLGIYTGGSSTKTTYAQTIFFGSDGNVGIGFIDPTYSFGARLDVQVARNLSTDIAFRVRNYNNTANITTIAGNGDFTHLGNLLLGAASVGTSGVTVFSILSGTAPSTSPADCAQIYTSDIAAGNACFHTMAEGGEIYYMGSRFGLQSNNALTFYTNDTLRGSFSTAGDFLAKFAVAFDGIQVYTTGGATVMTMNDNIRALYINPAAVKASLTITLPAAPIDGQEIIICFGGTIVTAAVVTALTISANAGQVLIGTPITTAVGGTSVSYKYESSTTYWRPI